MTYLFYNPLSNCGKNQQEITDIAKKYIGSDMPISVINKEKCDEVLSKITENDEIILVGGDGTLNHLINDYDTASLKCKLFYIANGLGNDFKNDVKDEITDEKIPLENYIKNLPTVTVNGKDYRFINGVGFGIDGYCCEVGDKLHAEGKTNVNYAGIAIKGLLFHFKRPNATITVDGVTKTYKKVWLAPTMKGRCYGGGMLITPNQNRHDEKGLVSVGVLYGANKLKTLMVFPSIFKGEHVKHKEMFEEIKGSNIKVEFDRPTSLQIDGETILGVKEYSVHI